MKKIVIIGQGFVGALMSIACARPLSSNKKPIYKVIGLDQKSLIGEKRVKNLNDGIFPFETNDEFLKKEFKKIIYNKNYSATVDKNELHDTDIFIVSINIDVSSKKYREKDLKNFKNLIKDIGLKYKKNSLIIIESTLPPGFCDKILKPILERVCAKRKIKKKDINLAYSYERVMPGKDYLSSLIYNHRVFSANNKNAEKKCENFLKKIIDTKNFPLTKLKSITATETAKILENTYRAVNIAFIDEWCKFADQAEIDLFEIINAIKKRNTHSNIRYPGLGVGGYCLTKDPLFVDYSSRQIFKKKKNIDFKFSNLSVKTNKLMPEYTCRKLIRNFKSLKNKTFLVAGVTYKNDVADTRQSPSKYLCDFIEKKGGKFFCLDPFLSYWEEKKMRVEKNLKIQFEVDAIIFAVPHTQFQTLNMKKFVSSKKTYILDANRCLTEKQKIYLKNNNYNFHILGSGIN
jgi:UDP-N-acetyl-D-glucosamine dehydrogenase